LTVRQTTRKFAFGLVAALAFGTLLIAAGTVYWDLSPGKLINQTFRIVAAHGLNVVYQDDSRQVEQIRSAYIHPEGALTGPGPSGRAALDAVERQIPHFRWVVDNPTGLGPISPFIYEQYDAQFLQTYREKNRIEVMAAAAASEYEAMLAVAAWVGTRFDHGPNTLGPRKKYDPQTIVQKGADGQAFWCEVAAILMVQTATAMAWPARLVTLSRNGYKWEHGVAELWSNQFDKWFVIDTDFNVTYTANGTPLSAYELCHRGPALQAGGRLVVHRIAPLKPSLNEIDMVPYYRYVSIDLRNDWYSRRLRRGSPAGGDLATWWTARPDIDRLLTAKVRVDDQETFDWPVNWVEVVGAQVQQNADGATMLRLLFAGYVPYFVNFQVAVDEGRWENIENHDYLWELAPGRHCLKARALTAMGWHGPERKMCYRFDGFVAPNR